jgi:hypothetical protein
VRLELVPRAGEEKSVTGLQHAIGSCEVRTSTLETENDEVTARRDHSGEQMHPDELRSGRGDYLGHAAGADEFRTLEQRVLLAERSRVLDDVLRQDRQGALGEEAPSEEGDDEQRPGQQGRPTRPNSKNANG